MAERDRMVWAHPSRNQSFPDYVGEATSKYEIDLSPIDRQQILAGDAQRLLHLPVSEQEA